MPSLFKLRSIAQFCYVALILLSIGWLKPALAAEVRAAGYGTTVDLATESAKLNALSQASGELLIGKRVYDGNLQEKIYSYTNGVIDSYQMLDFLCDRSICVVTILAIVTKRSDMVFQEVNSGEIPRFVDEDPDLLNYLRDQRNWYVVTIKDIDYEDRQNGVMQVTANGHVQVNSIWLDALKKYMLLTPASKNDRLTLVDGEMFHFDAQSIFLYAYGALSHNLDVRVCMQNEGDSCHYLSDGFGAGYGFKCDIFGVDPHYQYVENWHRQAAITYLINTKSTPFQYPFQINKQTLERYGSIKIIPKFLEVKAKKGLI